MSLFKTREWWRTQCGENETFDNHCLLVTTQLNAEGRSVIIVGSHSGHLRIYEPSSRWIEEGKTLTGYKPSDMIIEKSLDDPIIDLNVGKFVSGSQKIHLAILQPSNLVVYNASIARENNDDSGDRCQLKIVYEHNLKRLAATLTIGSFGGVNGRDFLCVQCLDGTLLFFEQETFTFSYNLPNYLLPNPMIYVPRNDTFVTLNAGWVLECWRYQHIAEFDDIKGKQSESGKQPYPEWKYNLGEAVLDMALATLSSMELAIVVLGERNLYCLRDNCTLKYTKRLEYTVLCFHVYVIEPDGTLMVMTVTETNTLMVYEGTTLRWSAQLSFAPVSLSRGNFQHLDGVIVILSETGVLEGCYLGTEPSLFVAPPISTKDFNYETAASEISRYRKILKRSATTDNSLTNATIESELSFTIGMSPHLEPCPYVEELSTEIEKHSMCTVSIELLPYAPLRQVEVSFQVFYPLVVSSDFHEITNLCDRHLLESLVYTSDKAAPASLEIVVTVTYENNFGALRVLQKRSQIPMRLVVTMCPPESTAPFSMIVKSTESIVSFGQLFPEFIGEAALTRSSSVVAFQYIYTGTIVTVVSATSSNRYRLQSEDNLAIALIAAQLINRLESHYGKKHCLCIGTPQLQILNEYIDAHFGARQSVKKIKEDLDLLSTQLRNIERRMVSNFKERSTRSLKSLTLLLDDTFDMTLKLLEDLRIARLEKKRTEENLYRAVTFLLLVLRTNVTEDKYVLLESAIGFKPQLNTDIDWEEITDAAVSGLLRSRSKKLDSEALKTPSNLEPLKDVTKLKKRVAHLVEKFAKDTANEIPEKGNAKLEQVREMP